MYSQAGKERESKSPRVTLLVDGPKKLRVTWNVQHRLDISVEPEGITRYVGEGWYSEGDLATVSIDSLIIELSKDARMAFYAWQGDVSSREPEITLKMDSPKSITAVFKKQFLLKITSEIKHDFFSQVLQSTILNLLPQIKPIVSGEGWYFQGEKANVSASITTTPIPGIKYVLQSWRGPVDVVKDNHVSTTINFPTTLVAVWRLDYSEFLIYVGILIAIAGAIAVVAKRTKRKREV